MPIVLAMSDLFMRYLANTHMYGGAISGFCLVLYLRLIVPPSLS